MGGGGGMFACVSEYVCVGVGEGDGWGVCVRGETENKEN